MSTNQEYWDACLIRGWRKGLTLKEVMKMYYSITKTLVSDSNLLRAPDLSEYHPDQITVFVAQRLPKISAWLFKCGPEHDATLLKKLGSSKYTLEAKTVSIPDPEKRKLYKQVHDDKMRREFTTKAAASRNSNTDWGVAKSPRQKAIR